MAAPVTSRSYAMSSLPPQAPPQYNIFGFRVPQAQQSHPVLTISVPTQPPATPARIAQHSFYSLAITAQQAPAFYGYPSYANAHQG
eukprot:487503-Ditylum_brightwellii.AAC.1